MSVFLQVVSDDNIANAANYMSAYFFKAKIIDQAIDVLTSKSTAIALGICVPFFLIAITYNYINTSIESLKTKESAVFFDPTEIARVLVIVGMISIYGSIMPVLVGAIDSFNFLTRPGSELSAEYGNLTADLIEKGEYNSANTKLLAIESALNDPKTSPALRTILEGQKKELESKMTLAKIESTDQKDSKSNMLSDTQESDKNEGAGFLGSMVFKTLAFVVWLLVGIIRIIITSITINVFKILIVLGPFAFAFSILPIFRSQVSHWFGSLLGTGLVFTTMNILDSILLAQLNLFKNYESDGTAIFAMSLTILVLYLMVFWLTSKFVGKGDGGRPVGKMISTMVAVAALIGSGGAAAPAAGNTLKAAQGAANDTITGN